MRSKNFKDRVNQQPSSYVYCSCDCQGRLYIGYHKGETNDDYLGSFTDESFKPKHKLVFKTHESKEIALLEEWGYHTAWNVHKHNPRFANKARCNFSGNVEAYQLGNPNSPSEETRKKISQTLKGNKAWNKGVTKEENPNLARSEEVKQRISNKLKGRQTTEMTDEIRAKISRTLTGKKQTQETKLKRTIRCSDMQFKMV